MVDYYFHKQPKLHCELADHFNPQALENKQININIFNLDHWVQKEELISKTYIYQNI